MERYGNKEMKDIDWTKYKIIVPTEKDRKELMEAFEYLHYCNIDTEFITVNQLVHEYLDEETMEGAKNNIIVNEELFKDLE